MRLLRQRTVPPHSIVGFDLKDSVYGTIYPYTKPALRPSVITFSLAGQSQTENNDATHLSAYDLNYATAEISGGKGVFAFKHLFAWLQVNVQPNEAGTVKEIVVSSGGGIANEGTLNLITGEVESAPESADETLVLQLGGSEGIEMPRSLRAFVTVPAGEYSDLRIVCGSYNRTIPGLTLLEGGHVYSVDLYGKLHKPAASPASGSLPRGSVVTLSSDEDADIYYTLDGSTPTEASALYTSDGIEITDECTIKAVAVKEGWTVSDVMTASYTIPAAPGPEISVSDDGTVTITSELEDAEIRYTIDGKAPKDSSPLYDPDNRPVLEGENITVSAIAISPRYEGYTKSVYYFRPVDIFQATDFEKLSQGTHNTKFCLYRGAGKYTYYDRIARFMMETGREDHIICVKRDKGFRSISIKAEGSEILKVLASDTTISGLNVYELEPVGTIVLNEGNGYVGKYTFPDGNDYGYIAIRPSSNCVMLGFEVAFE